MRNLSTLVRSSLVTCAAAAALFGLAAAPAAAVTSWTVSGGGSFSASSTDVVVIDSSTGVQWKCDVTLFGSTEPNGTYPDGHGLFVITGVTWTCTGPFGIVVTVTARNLPWTYDATGYDSATGVVTGALDGVEASISGSGCSADFAGGTPGSPATLDARYADNTKTLSLTGGGDLHVWNASGSCLGLFNSGDPVSVTGDFVFSGVQPAITGS